MSDPSPRITIGMPVYNGSRYIGLALDALLAQTYPHFVIVISDNASDDATPEIARAYAARDARVHYVRQRENLGVVRNVNAVAALARTPYFMWHADDDISDPRLLERCVACLDADPEVVLAYCTAIPIDADGAEIPHVMRPLDLGSRDPVRRFELCLDPTPYTENVIYGLMRRDVLEKTQRHGDFAGGDRALCAEIALHGRFARIDEPLFRRRIATQVRSAAETERYNTGRSARFSFREWRILAQNWRSIRRAPLPTATRRRLRAALYRRLREQRACYVGELKDAFRAIAAGAR